MMKKLLFIISIIILSGCGLPYNYNALPSPILEGHTVSAQLQIPSLFFSIGLRTKISNKSSIGINFSPLLMGAGVKVDYLYVLKETDRYKLMINPEASCNIALVMGQMYLGGSLLYHNNYLKKESSYYGIKYMNGVAAGGDDHKKLNVIAPFVGIITNNGDNFVEYELMGVVPLNKQKLVMWYGNPKYLITAGTKYEKEK